MLIEWLGVAECVRCGERGKLLCERCALPTPFVGRNDDLRWMAAAGRDPDMMRAVALWKDLGVTGLTRSFARLMAAAISELDWPPGAITALPARSASQRRRGWRPAAELAEATAAELGWPVDLGLLWRRQPRDQRGLSDVERRANLCSALEWLGGPGPVWLVDDVRTSGASLRAAALAIGEGGASAVAAAVLVSSRSPN